MLPSLPRALSKAVATLVVLAMSITGLWVTQRRAEAVEVQATIAGITYVADSDDVAAGATVKSYDVAAGLDVVIPATVELEGTTYEVTRIANVAFYRRGITSVVLPPTLVEIGDRAFRENALTAVHLGGRLRTIGSGAFESNAITRLDLPDSLITIGSEAFYRNAIAELTWGHSVVSIGASAFTYNKLTSLVLPDSVEVIGNVAFDANQIASLRFGSSLTTIGNTAFRGNKLTEVVIPDTVTSVGNNAFSNNLITTFTWPGSAPVMGAYVFGANQITSVTVPEGVTTIGAGAFSSNLITTVHIADTVEEIGNDAFRDNPVELLHLGSSVRNIGRYAFMPNQLRELVVPASVRDIGAAAFFQDAKASYLARIIMLGDAPTIVGLLPMQGTFPMSLGDPTKPGNKTVYYYETAAGFSRDWEGYYTSVMRAPVLRTVTFDTQGGGTIDPVEVSDGGLVAPPADPERPGYTFNGWHHHPLDDSPFDFSAPVGADVTVYAHWRGTPQVVTFDSRGGSPVSAQQVDRDDVVRRPTPDPRRVGYRFQGWFTEEVGGERYDFSTPVQRDFTLFARWVEESHTVTFLPRNGDDPVVVVVGHDDVVVPFADPVRQGHRFDGWWLDLGGIERYSFDLPIASDVTVYGVWEPLRLEVRFEFGDGRPPVVEQVRWNEKVAEPSPPVRDGHRFTGWFADEAGQTPFDFDSSITEPTVVHAGWAALDHVVSFETEGGGRIRPVTVPHGQTLDPVPTPRREGFTFIGWFTGPAWTDRFDATMPIEEDLTLYAAWTPTFYTVTFDSRGGSEVLAATVGYGERVAPPQPDPTLPGHAFLGWFTDVRLTDRFDFSSPVWGDLTLYAGWDLVGYPVSFDSQGGSVVAAVVVAPGARLAAPTPPSSRGYTFTGWFVDPAATQPYDFTAPVTGGFTLYAGWVLASVPTVPTTTTTTTAPGTPGGPTTPTVPGTPTGPPPTAGPGGSTEPGPTDEPGGGARPGDDGPASPGGATAPGSSTGAGSTASGAGRASAQGRTSVMRTDPLPATGSGAGSDLAALGGAGVLAGIALLVSGRRRTTRSARR